jgi:transposase
MEEMREKRRPHLTGPRTGKAIREESRREAERPSTPTKREYTPEFKQRVIRELASLAASGERGAQGAFLRREGLHWPTVHRWQKQAEEAERAALEPKKPGRRSTRNPAEEEAARLRRENERLQEKLRQAEIIIDVQKKLSALLGVELPETSDDEEETP